MSKFLNKLDDEKSILLLYLTDELGPEDKAQVEGRLEAEPALRAQLTQLQIAHAVYLQGMKSLALSTPALLPGDTAISRASRSTRQWVTRRLANPRPARAPRLLFPWWLYPMAAAAAVIVVFTSWGVDRHFAWWQQHQKDASVDSALTDPTLTYDQQEDLLNDCGLSEDAAPATPLDEADRTIASLQNQDDQDSLFVGIDGANTQRESMR